MFGLTVINLFSSSLFNVIWQLLYRCLSVKCLKSEEGRRVFDILSCEDSFAARSASSLPRIPMCPGIQHRMMSFEIPSSVYLSKNSPIRGFEKVLDLIDCKTERESENIIYFVAW